MMTVDNYIHHLADHSRHRDHEMVLDCLDHFGVAGTKDLTLEQVAEYWEVVRRLN